MGKAGESMTSLVDVSFRLVDVELQVIELDVFKHITSLSHTSHADQGGHHQASQVGVLVVVLLLSGLSATVHLRNPMRPVQWAKAWVLANLQVDPTA